MRGRPAMSDTSPATGRPAVLLDVDGTLVDNSYFHTIAWWRACRRGGVETTMAQVHRLIGMGADNLVPTLIGRTDDALAELHQEEMGKFADETVALPGAADLIVELRRRGAIVAVASSAKPAELDRLLRKVGPVELIDSIASSADAGSSKPAPDIFSVALARVGLAPEGCIALGDTRWDVEAAGRAGVECIGVLTGGWSAAELLDAGARAVFPTIVDLLNQLDDSPIGVRLRGVAA